MAKLEKADFWIFICPITDLVLRYHGMFCIIVFIYGRILCPILNISNSSAFLIYLFIYFY